MPEEIVMPRLSDTMEEGTIAQWLKREGDTVHKGEAILEVETDKANMELQAYSDGVIQQILRDDGATVPIGTVVGILTKVGEQAAPAASREGREAAQEVAVDAPAATPGDQEIPATAPVPAAVAAPTAAGNGTDGSRVKASPLARNLARQHNIDLVALGQGSGPGGRIVKGDIEHYLAGQGAGAVLTAPMPQAQDAEEVETAAAAPAAPQAAPQPAAAGADEVELRKPNRVQQVMARRLVESKTTVPHFYVTNEVDMAAAMELRKQLQATFGDEARISFNDLIVRACALTLRAMPEVNTSWRDGQFAVHSRVNVGVAVSLPDGLVVPVIHDADRKTLREIAAETRALAEKARAGKLAPHEMAGGTFTVSNLGSIVKDLDEFQAIINPPESAIVAVGGIIEKPVALDGQVVIRPRMKLSLSVDHRVVPGVPAAQFLHNVKTLLQEPLRLGF